MKVALVTRRFANGPGGAERFSFGLARYLCQRGHQVSVLASDIGHHLDGAAIHRIPLAIPNRALQTLLFNRRSARQLARGQFDILHSLDRTLPMDVFQPCFGVRPAVLEAMLESGPRPLQSLRRLARRFDPTEQGYRMIERRQYRMQPPPLYLAVSRLVARQMERFYSVDPGQIRLIGNGCDLRRFDPSKNREKGQELRQQLGIQSGELVFLFVSNNFQLKGLGPLLKAASLLVAQGRRFHLLVAGADSSASYRRRSTRGGIADRVHFLGPVEEIEKCYAASDVLVLPTYYDACATVVFEALASGLPVITTRRNGAAEAVQDGAEGFLYDHPDNLEALLNSLKLYFDPSLLKRHSSAARAKGQRYPIEASYQIVEAAYNEILARS